MFEFRPIRFLRNLRRSRQIATVLLTYGFADLVERLRLMKYVQWGQRIVFWWRRGPVQRLNRAQRIRRSLESLGATFIKFGQVMSTRPDLIPADVIAELEKLQEQVPPFPSDLAVKVVEEQFGAAVDELFARFDREPIAAGSLAQVHRARHLDGTEVAVKIRRPGIVRKVERDVSLMLELAHLVERHIPEAAIFDPVGLVTHFARTIRREMSFTREGRTLDEFARLFRNDATLIVPKVFWDLTNDSVLTMQYIGGCRVNDFEGFSRYGISRKVVAANGARIFLKQALEFGFFHGDPHPGNIRVMRGGAIALLDYGMVGVIDEELRESMVDLLLAVSRKDVRWAVDLVQVVGQPTAPVDVPMLRVDIRDFVDNYYGQPLEKISIGQMLQDFVSLLSTHSIRCPADLMLLIRAIVQLDGVGRDLDPAFNLAEHLAPFVAQVVRERYNPRRIANRLFSESRRFLQLAHDLPFSVGRTLDKLSRDDLKVQLEHRSLEHLITELDRSSNRVVISLVMAALIVGSALLIRAGAASPWINIPIYAAMSFLGIWLIYGVFRSGRL